MQFIDYVSTLNACFSLIGNNFKKLILFIFIRITYLGIKKYFKESTKSHGGYAINFFLCEILALINVVGQIYFTDR